MSKETLERVSTETRKRGLPLIAHANAIDMQRIAVEAQVDVFSQATTRIARCAIKRESLAAD